MNNHYSVIFLLLIYMFYIFKLYALYTIMYNVHISLLLFQIEIHDLFGMEVVIFSC